MFNKMITTDKNGARWSRESKLIARNMHIMGYDVIVVPCNCVPFTPWHIEGTMTPSDDFDKYVDSFTYYNCNNKMGRYPSFYIAID